MRVTGMPVTDLPKLDQVQVVDRRREFRVAGGFLVLRSAVWLQSRLGSSGPA